MDSLAVLRVADERMGNPLQVATDLVLPSCFDFGFDEAVASGRKFSDRDRKLGSSQGPDSRESLLRFRIRDVSKRIVFAKRSIDNA